MVQQKTMAGTISSPLLTGVCFDVLGSYNLAWFVLAALNLAAIPLILKIRPPAYRQRSAI